MQPCLTAFARPEIFGVIFVVASALVALPAFYFVHRVLGYCYFLYARQFCRKRDFEILRWRCGPQFDKSGVKTEYTIVELDCLDVHKQRKLVRLLVWIFGVRKILSDGAEPLA